MGRNRISWIVLAAMFALGGLQSCGSGETTDTCAPACAGLECGDDGCGGTCGKCPGAVPVCKAGQCIASCVADCEGKECGDDGCGGSCGSCAGDGKICIDGSCIGGCEPDCEGKECGPDGCDGECGTCPADAPVCSDGLCELPCKPDCEGRECGDDDCGGTCGKCPDVAPVCEDFKCVSDCVPDCEGKECGPDGCGEECGSCDDGDQCLAGVCECAPDCDGKECGPDGCEGSCGNCPADKPLCKIGICEAKPCEPDCEGKECGDDGCGAECGSCPDSTPMCEEGKCVPDCSPDCEDKECGDDGCGGTCGKCPAIAPECENFKCIIDCQPDCDGKECGDNGCKGICGTCPGAAPKCVDFLCTPDCLPDCGGKSCGPDGCGGVCGNCPAAFVCVSGNCECIPSCSGKECGPDGCGGLCGQCEAQEQCIGATCICVPTCGNKKCGPDGCGGSCGSCQSGWFCTNGSCAPPPALDCQGANAPALAGCAYVATYEGCCLSDTLVWCDDGDTYCLDCGQNPVCGWSAEPMFYDCGTDGSGDPSGEFLKQCEGGSGCIPDCAGKDCGDDGCGGTCGACTGEWQLCDDSHCLAPCGDLTGEWTWYALNLYDGLCWGEDFGLDATFYGVVILEKDGTYAAGSVGLMPDEPDFLSYSQCVFSIESCNLQCTCDSTCLAAYYAAYEAYSGYSIENAHGVVSMGFTFGDDQVEVAYWQSIFSIDDYCILESFSYVPGDGQQCAPCPEFDDCSAYLLCLDYANYSGNAFCTAQCAEDADCPEGFECDTQGSCWTPSSVPGVCIEGDAWFEDPCGNVIGPWDSCSPAQLCSAGACAAAPKGKIGSPCLSGVDCLEGPSPICLTEPDNGFPGGYCTSVCNSAGAGPCPSGSTCFNIPNEGFSLCFDDCISGNDCRGAYFCDQDSTCFPE